MNAEARVCKTHMELVRLLGSLGLDDEKSFDVVEALGNYIAAMIAATQEHRP